MFRLDDFAVRLDDSIIDAATVNTRKASLALSWSALGGDESARWDEVGADVDLWQWINRLGRGVEVYDPYGDLIWEGFVHGVKAQIEGRNLAFSLDGMWNRLAVMFSFIRYMSPTSGDFQIAGTPSGSTLQYDDGAGGDPAGESDLVGMEGGTMLYNQTQEEEATIQSVDGATNTITLTAPVPGTWADNDDLLYGPIMGQEVTDWVDDEDSQDRYGVKEKLVSRAGMTTETAENERDALLDLRAWPLGEMGLTAGTGKMGKVTVEALGWWAMCKWRLWHWAHRGVLSAQDQVKLIRSEKLDFLDTDESQIEDIGHLFSQHREDYNDAQAELLELAAMGDETTQARVLVGVESGKRLYLRTADTTEKYVYRSGGRWYNSARQRLDPWRVRPDGKVRAEDVVPATVVLAGVADPSSFYLERVEWTWPDRVTPTPLGGVDLERLIGRGIRV